MAQPAKKSTSQKIMDGEYEPAEEPAEPVEMSKNLFGEKTRAATVATRGALGHAADILDSVADVVGALQPENGEGIKAKAEAVRARAQQAQVVGAIASDAADRLGEAIPRISRATDGLMAFSKKIFNGKKRSSLLGAARKR